MFGAKHKGPVYKTEGGKTVVGLLARFATPADLFHAAENVRDAGYKKWDTHSPFPVHDMEEAMGVKGKLLTPFMYVIGAAALTGVVFGFGMQYWINTDYMIVTQGKPTYQAWEPFMPITFELGILFTAFASIIGMMAFNGLPRHNHPLFNNESFLSSSDDSFFISIESQDPSFDPDQTRAMLEKAGAVEIEFVEDDE